MYAALAWANRRRCFSSSARCGRLVEARATRTGTNRARIDSPVGRSSPVDTTRPRGGRSACAVMLAFMRPRELRLPIERITVSALPRRESQGLAALGREVVDHGDDILSAEQLVFDRRSGIAPVGREGGCVRSRRRGPSAARPGCSWSSLTARRPRWWRPREGSTRSARDMWPRGVEPSPRADRSPGSAATSPGPHADPPPRRADGTAREGHRAESAHPRRRSRRPRAGTHDAHQSSSCPCADTRASESAGTVPESQRAGARALTSALTLARAPHLPRGQRPSENSLASTVIAGKGVPSASAPRTSKRRCSVTPSSSTISRSINAEKFVNDSTRSPSRLARMTHRRPSRIA